MLLSVPGASSSPKLPGTVTRPGLPGCLNCRWLPLVRANCQPYEPANPHCFFSVRQKWLVKKNAATLFPKNTRPILPRRFGDVHLTFGSCSPAPRASRHHSPGGWCLSHSIIGTIGFLEPSIGKRLYREQSVMITLPPLLVSEATFSKMPRYTTAAFSLR